MQKLGEDEICLGKRIRLIPTKEQEKIFWRSCGVARWAYNIFLYETETIYEYEKRKITSGELLKAIHNVLKPYAYSWLNEVSCNVCKLAVKDAEEAYKQFRKGISQKPKFKKKGKCEYKFQISYETTRKISDHMFHGEKFGNVKTVEPLPDNVNGKHFTKCKIGYDGQYWYLSVGYVTKKNIRLNYQMILSVLTLV